MALISQWQKLDNQRKAEMRGNAYRCFVNRFEITQAAMNLLKVLGG